MDNSLLVSGRGPAARGADVKPNANAEDEVITLETLPSPHMDYRPSPATPADDDDPLLIIEPEAQPRTARWYAVRVLVVLIVVLLGLVGRIVAVNLAATRQSAALANLNEAVANAQREMDPLARPALVAPARSHYLATLEGSERDAAKKRFAAEDARWAAEDGGQAQAENAGDPN